MWDAAGDWDKTTACIAQNHFIKEGKKTDKSFASLHFTENSRHRKVN